MFERMKEDIAVIRDRAPAASSALEVMLLYNGFKAVRALWASKHYLAKKAERKARRAAKKAAKANKT